MQQATQNFLHIKRLARRNFILIAGVFLLVTVGLSINIWQLRSIRHTIQNGPGGISVSIRSQLERERQRIHDLQNEQLLAGEQQVTPGDIEAAISRAELSLAQGDLHASRIELGQLTVRLNRWQAQIEDIRLTQATAAHPAPTGAVTVPILMYHYTPGDFEAQLQSLVDRHYTTISLDELIVGLYSPSTLPAKPVVITFDDGYTNQLRAVSLLQRYRMKATFYIIVGGPGSNYCIGANRTNLSCGDSYLSWDQIRGIDADPLFTIAAHTIDHLALGGLSAESQREQIAGSKRLIEARLGHPIQHFAYPYGSFNATSMAEAQAAGYATAVSTMEGTMHSVSTLYDLYRLRHMSQLP